MSEPSITITAEEISDLMADIMELYPDENWRRVDRERDYPEAFVQELTRAGLLSSLIPEEYGGTGQPIEVAAQILTEIHCRGGNAAQCALNP